MAEIWLKFDGEFAPALSYWNGSAVHFDIVFLINAWQSRQLFDVEFLKLSVIKAASLPVP